MHNIMREIPTADMISMNGYARVLSRHLVPILNDEREHPTGDLPGPYAGAEAATTVQRRVWLSNEVITAAMT